MRTMHGLAFLASAALSGLLAFVPAARAAGSRIYHGASCYGAQGLVSATGQVVNTSSATASLVCPVLTGTDFHPSPANAVFVSGYQHALPVLNGVADQRFAITFQACATFHGGGGGTCGTASKPNVTNGGVFEDVSIRDLSAWPTALDSDYLYVHVNLPPPTNGSDNVLFGFQVNGN